MDLRLPKPASDQKLRRAEALDALDSVLPFDRREVACGNRAHHDAVYAGGLANLPRPVATEVGSGQRKLISLAARRAALRHFHPCAELHGMCMIELVHPDDRGRTLQKVGHIMAGEPASRFHNRYVRKDGSVVNIEWSARWSDAHQARFAIGRAILVRS